MSYVFLNAASSLGINSIVFRYYCIIKPPQKVVVKTIHNLLLFLSPWVSLAVLVLVGLNQVCESFSRWLGAVCNKMLRSQLLSAYGASHYLATTTGVFSWYGTDFSERKRRNVQDLGSPSSEVGTLPLLPFLMAISSHKANLDARNGE